MRRLENGQVWLDGNTWKIDAKPHIRMAAKRIFAKIDVTNHDELELTNTPEAAFELRWFLQRYPLSVLQPEVLERLANEYTQRVQTVEEIAGGMRRVERAGPPLALPLRKYQQQFVDLFLSGACPLNADELGIGKTAQAIGCFTPHHLPALVVCLPNLALQWQREIRKFAPHLRTHILRTMAPYPLPKENGRGPDVLISSYHKLSSWCEELASVLSLVVYDEVQELRRSGTNKHKAALHLAKHVDRKLGLSATPVYNYGGEIFNVLEVLDPGRLGNWNEFLNEWCIRDQNTAKVRLREPDVLSSWLVSERVMIRRTRAEVGRELPPLTQVTHEIESDAEALKKVEGKAGELAQILLSKSEAFRGQRMSAAEQFSNVLRQATGLAKAPYVADFVRLIVESGHPVVLYGWHRAVYEIWREELEDLSPAYYTGSESQSRKQQEIERFREGQTDVLIMSLRCAAGVDGLQDRCQVLVFGELDWSPAVHEQNVGRAHRDGQKHPVTAYYLVSEGGLDPLMAETLGIKKDQVEGVRSAGRERPRLERRVDSAAQLMQLAERYARRAK